MENNTIKCPFCLKESQRGVHVCTGCMATVLYGTFPGWYAFVVILLTFGLSILIGMSTGMAGATISLPIIAAVGFVAGKAIFSDNVVFQEKNVARKLLYYAKKFIAHIRLTKGHFLLI
jgi:hypothetical protein